MVDEEIIFTPSKITAIDYYNTIRGSAFVFITFIIYFAFTKCAPTLLYNYSSLFKK